MRFLHCDLGNAAAPVLEEFYDDIPPYAILSHRWGKANEEVSFKDIETGADISKREGYRKLQYCCQQARKDGFKYVWIDTCCIDKSSSAELSEAINSMYNYYMLSQVCYVYLNDVSCPISRTQGNPATNILALKGGNSSFRKSAWFTRGWTLQELIAPENVRFFDQNWQFIGDKQGLADLVSEITRISREVLTHRLKPSSVAQRMSWAAGRKTTRVEDRAYSLMGIFGVNMPPLYGEGNKAFIRLQEEIMRQSFDHTLFAWQPSRSGCGFLAESPDQFSNCGNIVPISYDKYVLQLKIEMDITEYAQTNFGTRIRLPLERTNVGAVYRAYLACTRQIEAQNERGQPGRLVYIHLIKEPGAAVDTYSRYFDGQYGEDINSSNPLSLQALTIYISRSRDGQFEQRPSPKLLVDLRVYTTIDDLYLSYYYGGKVCYPTKTGNEAFIDIGLEKNEDSVVTIRAGYFIEPNNTGYSDERVDVYAIFGIHEGHIWTDIHAEPHAQTGGWFGDKISLLHAEYLKKHKNASIPRCNSTKKHWVGWPERSEPNHRRFDGSITIVADNFQPSRYQATVHFTATEPSSLQVDEKRKKRFFF